MIGGLAIYLSARIVANVDDYRHAVFTALLGAIAWTVSAWIPLFGTLIAPVGWIGVITCRYPGGWLNAGKIGVGSRLSRPAIPILNSVFGLEIDAVGIPGM